MAQLLKVEIDGKQVEVPHGTMLMEGRVRRGGGTTRSVEPTAESRQAADRPVRDGDR
jgi:hypothetical protein